VAVNISHCAINFTPLDKGLETESVTTRETGVPTSVSDAPGPTCDKRSSRNKTQSGVGKWHVKKRKHTGDQEYPKQRCVICGDVVTNSRLLTLSSSVALGNKTHTQINIFFIFSNEKW
jgi:hypothetical protein